MRVSVGATLTRDSSHVPSLAYLQESLPYQPQPQSVLSVPIPHVFSVVVGVGVLFVVVGVGVLVVVVGVGVLLVVVGVGVLVVVVKAVVLLVVVAHVEPSPPHTSQASIPAVHLQTRVNSASISLLCQAQTEPTVLKYTVFAFTA